MKQHSYTPWNGLEGRSDKDSLKLWTKIKDLVAGKQREKNQRRQNNHGKEYKTKAKADIRRESKK